MPEVEVLQTVVPASEGEVASFLAQANRDGLAVIQRGGGTKTQWGNPVSRPGVMLSTARLNRVLEHAWADLTVTVEAGCTIAELQKTLAQHGQRLAVDPIWPEHATVGGVLSTNDTGVLRLRYGGLRDLVIGVTLALADGTLAMSGGKVVKNVAGYDLPKLVTGALGTLGVITKAVFRLHPLPNKVRHVSVEAPDLRTSQQIILKIFASHLVPAAVQVRAMQGTLPKVDVMFEGTEEGIAAQMHALSAIAPFEKTTADIWTRMDADAKLSILPTQIASTLAGISGDAVMQATGLGWIRQKEGLAELRASIEKGGGSLMLLRPHGEPHSQMDAWGSAGDAVALMREVKRQFDPKNILNPGRFVHGI
jgi:glycolate oxidase FAD binding subunit